MHSYSLKTTNALGEDSSVTADLITIVKPSIIMVIVIVAGSADEFIHP